MGPRDHIVEMAWLSWATLPLRIVLWAAMMCMVYPLTAGAALFFAVFLRITRGTADVILRHSLTAARGDGVVRPTWVSRGGGQKWLASMGAQSPRGCCRTTDDGRSTPHYCMCDTIDLLLRSIAGFQDRGVLPVHVREPIAA